ncbi:hypothetical protein B0H34DRAFT_193719 [Crassisporium funariophilum]|nr:hypothetical protein B0H34DRAFT_193719 [Crassisporium funariophilum]
MPMPILNRLAGKFHKKRVHQAMQDQYREIGLSSIVSAAYTREDGKLVVDAYDRISELTGVALPLFEQMYSNEMLTMKASLLKYLLAIRAKQIQGATTIGATVNAEGPKVALTYTAAGFPILLRPMSTRGWKKDHWETLFMDYMGCHYKLATGGKSSHPPYSDIQQQQMTFIENKYLPRNMKIAQARNLKQDQIVMIFEYIGQRQEMHGPVQAFRFKSILKRTDKGKEILAARYPDADAGANPDPKHHRNADAKSEGQQNHGTTANPRGRPTRGKKLARASRPGNADAEPERKPKPDASADAKRGNTPEAAYVLVEQDVANQMQTVGLQIPNPCNGPADGSPQYAIPRDIYETFLQQTTTSSSKAPSDGVLQPCINPRLLNPGMPTPSPSPSPTPLPMPTRRIQPTRQGKRNGR